MRPLPLAVAIRAGVRKYPAGRRPTSRPLFRRVSVRRGRAAPRRRSAPLAPGLLRTYRQVFMERHSRIYRYRLYLRDTPARIVRPNNMPAAARHTDARARARTLLLPTMVSFVSTANIYDVTP